MNSDDNDSHHAKYFLSTEFTCNAAYCATPIIRYPRWSSENPRYCCGFGDEMDWTRAAPWCSAGAVTSYHSIGADRVYGCVTVVSWSNPILTVLCNGATHELNPEDADSDLLCYCSATIEAANGYML